MPIDWSNERKNKIFFFISFKNKIQFKSEWKTYVMRSNKWKFFFYYFYSNSIDIHWAFNNKSMITFDHNAHTHTHVEHLPCVGVCDMIKFHALKKIDTNNNNKQNNEKRFDQNKWIYIQTHTHSHKINEYFFHSNKQMMMMVLMKKKHTCKQSKFIHNNII